MSSRPRISEFLAAYSRYRSALLTIREARRKGSTVSAGTVRKLLTACADVRRILRQRRA